MGFFKKKTIAVFSPVQGELVPLSSVNDPVFAEGMLGKGAAVIPSDGKIVSPVNGKVITIFDTKHAIGLKSKDGVEVLIHIGLDTVKLNGEFFTAHVQAEEKVKIGDLLVEVDLEKIKEAGYDVITPVIVTNSDAFSDVKPLESCQIKDTDQILAVSK